MTKKEMVYEILSHTKLSGVSERGLNASINRTSKAWIEKVYKAYTNDKAHALYYFHCLFGF